MYRARDTRLNRDVAIKILPEIFAADTERVARFQREAQVLASLNHPNIAHIHGLEEAGGSKALVLEFVDGPTLADLIREGSDSAGRSPANRAANCRSSRSCARERYHSSRSEAREHQADECRRSEGVGFCSAKTQDVSAVVRDFSRADMSQSPTITSPAMTMGGMILGTAVHVA